VGLFLVNDLSSAQHLTPFRPLSPALTGISGMSEALLYDLSQQLRLLARASVRTTTDGRILSGQVDYSLEHLRSGVNEALDHLQDRGSLSPVDQACLATATRVIDSNRPLIRDLRRQLEAIAA
jgi:hypothetical protein